jgi:tetratricopeptide (TPR) repeat protein
MTRQPALQLIRQLWRGKAQPASSPKLPAASEGTHPLPEPVAAPSRRHPASPGEIRERLEEINKFWKRKQKRRAAILAAQLYEDAPDDKTVVNIHSNCLFEMRDMDRARAVTAAGLEKFKDWRLLTRLCLIQVMSGRHAEALRTTAGYFADETLSAHALLCHGAVLARSTGELDEAVEFFHRAVQAGHLRADHEPARRALSNSQFEALTLLGDDREKNPIHFIGPPPISGAEAVIAASADETYFRALFPLYRDTFLAHHPDAKYVLHIHVFDPSPALLEEIAAEQQASNGRLHFSYERTAGNRSYYYAGRMVQAPRLMERYERPLVVTDIDLYFKGPVGEILTATAGADLGILHIARRGLCPWRTYLAGLIVFNPTPAAKRLATGMQNFLLNLPPDIDYWYIDQLALFQSVYLSRNRGLGKIVDVTEKWRQLLQQGTGLTGQPDAKADRMRRKLAGQAPQHRAQIEVEDAVDTDE